MKIPELLGPAGNEKALHAAVAAGADAVYLGLDQFNARRNADNFTLDTLEGACDYAHLRGSRVYVTMNTIILPDELDSALECARQAYLRGIDALIVQDIGLASLISRCLPQLRLHISTQMNIHSEYGIQAAAALGAKRVTLARELSLPEIEHLSQVAHSMDVEVEAFGHGALCICYSGQCFMSSMIGGRSANRGLCAQACRLPYTLVDPSNPDRELKSPGEFLLSPKDLCSIDVIDKLSQANIDSLKIEGRMKSAEYVYSVISVYRKVLDRLASHEESAAHSEKDCNSESVDGSFERRPIRVRATEEEREQLASVFSRGFSEAYLIGQRGNNMMSYQRPNNRGQFVGRVKAIRDGVVHLPSEIALEGGDLLEFWTRKGNVVFELPSDFEAGRKTVYIPLNDLGAKVQKNDRVFRVRSARAAFKDDEHAPRIPVVGRVEIHLNKPLRVEFRVANPEEVNSSSNLSRDDAFSNELAGGLAKCISKRLSQQDSHLGDIVGVAEGVTVEAARSKAICAQEVYEHVDRMGSTPFELCQLKVDIDEGVGLGYSQIHRCRSAALDALAEKILDSYKNRTLKKAPSRNTEKPHSHNREIELCAIATNPDCARAVKRVGADAVYVPALNYKYSQSQTAGVLDEEPRSAGYPKNCRLIMPVVDHDRLDAQICDGEQDAGCAQGVKDERSATIDRASVETPTHAGECANVNGEMRIGLDVWDLVQPQDTLMVESLSSAQHAIDAEASIEIGPHLPIVNKASTEVAYALGAQCVWLSPELNIHQIRQIAANSPVAVGVTVFGAQELMVSEHCLLMSEAACSENCANCTRRKRPHTLRDRKGYEFPVVTDALGRSHLYNSVKLDAIGALSELIDAGVTRFMIDTTLLDAEQSAQAMGRLCHALGQVQSGAGNVEKIANTTTGHLFRGVL